MKKIAYLSDSEWKDPSLQSWIGAWMDERMKHSGACSAGAGGPRLAAVAAGCFQQLAMHER